MEQLRIDRHPLLSKDFLHAEADAGSIAAAFTGIFLLRGLCKVVAVLLAKDAADLPVLPETAPAAA